MRITIHRWPVLSVDKTEQGARRFSRTKKPTITMDTTCELLPRGVHVLFAMGDWRDFYFEGHATTEKMRDWVIDPASVKEIAKERVRLRQALLKAQAPVGAAK